jgi:hypothetical protein
VPYLAMFAIVLIAFLFFASASAFMGVANMGMGVR